MGFLAVVSQILIEIFHFLSSHWHVIGAMIALAVLLMCEPYSGVAAVAHLSVVIFAGIAIVSYGSSLLQYLTSKK